MLGRTAVTLAKRSLEALGLELRRIDREPPAPVYGTVKEALSKTKSGSRAAYKCPLSQLRTFNGLKFDAGGWHPFVAASHEYIDSNRTAYPGSALEAFYQKWQPNDALNALIGATGPEILCEFPSYTLHLPWLDVLPAERASAMAKNIRNENRWCGKIDLSASAGYGLHGPVSPKKGQIEYTRIVRTTKSIRRYGFDRARAEEDITVTAIERGDDYRFCIIHGQHRAAVLAALGYQHVPVSLMRTVFISEVEHWPQVYRGIWAQAEAETYVNHLFDFDSHAWAQEKGLVE
jgi:hypothetical protein